MDDLEPFDRSEAGRPVFEVEAVECLARSRTRDTKYKLKILSVRVVDYGRSEIVIYIRRMQQPSKVFPNRCVRSDLQDTCDLV